jgi:1-acyl-sn-glycerol-3-phosphate acyltransferase
VRLALFVLFNAVVIPAYVLCRGPLARYRRPLQRVWAKGCCWLAGIRVKALGEADWRRSVLYVSNHVSYMDIPVLSSLLAGTFVAKSEVAGWPLFGLAARVTGTIFIRRQAAEAAVQGRKMRERLLAGERLILFPEGTSTDGSAVAPFKTSLFAIAEPAPGDPGVVVQPIAIAYTEFLDGTRLVGPLRACYAWFGDATLLPHLFRLVGYRGCVAEVRFLPPIIGAQAGGRKALARLAEAAVAGGVAAAHGSGEALGHNLEGDQSRPRHSAAEAPSVNEARREAVGDRRRSAPAGR